MKWENKAIKKKRCKEKNVWGRWLIKGVKEALNERNLKERTMWRNRKNIKRVRQGTKLKWHGLSWSIWQIYGSMWEKVRKVRGSNGCHGKKLSKYCKKY